MIARKAIKTKKQKGGEFMDATTAIYFGYNVFPYCTESMTCIMGTELQLKNPKLETKPIEGFNEKQKEIIASYLGLEVNSDRMRQLLVFSNWYRKLAKKDNLVPIAKIIEIAPEFVLKTLISNPKESERELRTLRVFINTLTNI